MGRWQARTSDKAFPQEANFCVEAEANDRILQENESRLTRCVNPSLVALDISCVNLEGGVWEAYKKAPISRNRLSS